MDKYQERYEEHIKNKLNRDQIKYEYTPEQKASLMEIIENRKSIRRFNKTNLDDSVYNIIYKALETAPSSCNRKGIYMKEALPGYAEEILIGGKGWIHKADKVFFLFGAKKCYKNPKEIAFMPYLDAGCVVENIYLLCETAGIGCCFVNPNVREEHKQYFDEYFEDYFCGAIAVGNYG